MVASLRKVMTFRLQICFCFSALYIPAISFVFPVLPAISLSEAMPDGGDPPAGPYEWDAWISFRSNEFGAASAVRTHSVHTAKSPLLCVLVMLGDGN